MDDKIILYEYVLYNNRPGNHLQFYLINERPGTTNVDFYEFGKAVRNVNECNILPQQKLRILSNIIFLIHQNTESNIIV